MSIRTVTALCLLTLVSASASADEVRAVLTQVTGAPMVYELSDGEVRHVSMVAPGRSYSLPLEVVTGEDDSATFALPNSLIEVLANSMMRIVAPEPGTTSVVQRILQNAGSVLFRVHKGTLERFQVETPFLVSVVKGTVFNVLVRDDGATVSLQEGWLQVNSVGGRQSVELRPGDTAFSGRDGVVHLLEVQLAATPAAVATPVVAVGAPVVGAMVSPVVETVVSPVVDAVQDPLTSDVVDPLVMIVEPIVPESGVALVDTVPAPLIEPIVPELESIVPDALGDVVGQTTGGSPLGGVIGRLL